MSKTAEPAVPQPKSELPHNLILEDRRRLTATGVTKVISCDAFSACMDTSKGRLTIAGRELSVSELSLETGEVKVSGRIDQIDYAETRESSGGFLRRLVR